MTAMILRTLPVSMVLFAMPTAVILLALIGAEQLDLWPALGPPSTRHLIAFFTILGLVAGIIGAMAAYLLQKLIAQASVSLPGHFLVGWPVYLGVGWLALNWYVIPHPPGSPTPSGAHTFLMYSFTLAQGMGLAAHLCLMLLRQRNLGHGQGHEPG